MPRPYDCHHFKRGAYDLCEDRTKSFARWLEAIAIRMFPMRPGPTGPDLRL